ncbi:MAG: hypothetical protein PSN04_10670 [Methyloprofundus sp.]|nr:hypothetical protein [Methyloprofundus sp.]
MNKLIFSLIYAISLSSYAAANPPENKGKNWNGSAISNEVITQVQKAKSSYKQCVYTEAQKKGYVKIDSRVATDAIMKRCEPSLGKVRTIFINAGVPTVSIDRFLKKTRVDLTRSILRSLMFAEAARKAGAQ